MEIKIRFAKDDPKRVIIAALFVLSAAAQGFAFFDMLKRAFADVGANWFNLANAAYFLLFPLLWAAYVLFFPRRPAMGALLCFGGAAYNFFDLINITGLFAGESFVLEITAESVCLIAEYAAFLLIGLCILGALRSRTAAVTVLVMAFEIVLYCLVKNAVVYAPARVFLWFHLFFMISKFAFYIALIALFAGYAADEYKKMPPVWLCIVLSVMTLGAYAFVCLLKLVRLNSQNRDKPS